jgi:dephospho-CoA kinase
VSLPLSVGLTGRAASGKSTVAALWAEAGVPVIRADDLAREVVQPGTPGLQAVVQAMGPELLTPEGTLDRSALRERVFRDPEARRCLEAILHPRIQALREGWIAARGAEGHALVVSEIPLLFEAGLEGTVHRIVLVETSTEEALARLVNTRGIDPEEASRILATQVDPARVRGAVHYRIENNGTPAELAARAEAVLRALRDEAGARSSAPHPGLAPPPSAPLRLDLHTHTLGSWDSATDPEVLLARAVARGVDRVAITDHNRLHVALAMAARYPDRVIPGEEVKTAEGIDLIGLYLQEEIPKGTPWRETARRIREQGGIVYLPHPYAGGKGGGGRLAEAMVEEAQVVEVFNARLLAAGANARGLELALRTGRLQGAGSDAHTPGEVGNATVRVPWHPNEPQALLEALKGAQVEGRRAHPGVFLASNWAKLRKGVGLGPADLFPPCG